VTVLADTALRAKDIDEAKAMEAKQRAEQALSDRKDDFDYAKAQSELAEAIAQLRTLENVRKKLK
jgi:F-type H+-transporting ATPase subunit epsilon